VSRSGESQTQIRVGKSRCARWSRAAFTYEQFILLRGLDAAFLCLDTGTKGSNVVH
jgi:hypothetical protein